MTLWWCQVIWTIIFDDSSSFWPEIIQSLFFYLCQQNVFIFFFSKWHIVNNEKKLKLNTCYQWSKTKEWLRVPSFRFTYSSHFLYLMSSQIGRKPFVCKWHPNITVAYTSSRLRGYAQQHVYPHTMVCLVDIREYICKIFERWCWAIQRSMFAYLFRITWNEKRLHSTFFNKLSLLSACGRLWVSESVHVVWKMTSLYLFFGNSLHRSFLTIIYFASRLLY